MKHYLLLIALLALAACSSPEERAREAAQKAVDACTRSGFTPGTEPFDDCTLSMRERAKDQSKRDRIESGQQIRDFQSGHPGQSNDSGNIIEY